MTAKPRDRALVQRAVRHALLATCLASCAAPTSSSDADPSQALGEIEGEPAPGDEGAGVSAVHAYLQQRGYFPSDALARQFPDFAPPFEAGPADPSVYDEVLADAVMAYQYTRGLEPTCVADQATISAMMAPHCGNPDFSGVAPKAGTRKFDHLPYDYADRDVVTYRVADYGTLSQTAVDAALSEAADTWSNAMAPNVRAATPTKSSTGSKRTPPQRGSG